MSTAPSLDAGSNLCWRNGSSRGTSFAQAVAAQDAEPALPTTFSDGEQTPACAEQKHFDVGCRPALSLLQSQSSFVDDHWSETFSKPTFPGFAEVHEDVHVDLQRMTAGHGAVTLNLPKCRFPDKESQSQLLSRQVRYEPHSRCALIAGLVMSSA